MRCNKLNNNFNYFKEQNSLDYVFIKAPKAIFHDEKYLSLSSDAKFLYIAMLERQSLSLQNGWKDDNGNVYIILTHENAKQILSCSDSKTTKIFAQLESAGLIKRKRRRLGKPDIIYLNYSALNENTSNCKNDEKINNSEIISESETLELQNKEVQTFKNENSEVLKNESSDSIKLKANNINNNKNKKNNINSSFSPRNPEKWIEERKDTKEFIMLNIDYNALIKS